MKRVMIFIGLKLAEIGGVAVVIFLLSRVGNFINNILDFDTSLILDFVFGFLCTGTVLVVMCGLFLIIKANWEKAGDIADRL